MNTTFTHVICKHVQLLPGAHWYVTEEYIFVKFLSSAALALHLFFQEHCSKISYSCVSEYGIVESLRLAAQHSGVSGFLQFQIASALQSESSIFGLSS